MKRFSKLGLAVAAACLAGLSASTAQAVTVAYTTTGTFSSSGTNVSTHGGSTITFTGAPSSTNLTGPAVAGFFGRFVLNTTSATMDSWSESFVLTIAQALPVAVPNVGSSTASVVGNVSLDALSGVLLFSFSSPITDPNNPDLTIGTIIYHVNDLTVSIPTGYVSGTNTAPFELTGRINIPGNTPNVVPVPGAMTAGLVLLGSLGMAKKFGKRAASQV